MKKWKKYLIESLCVISGYYLLNTFLYENTLKRDHEKTNYYDIRIQEKSDIKKFLIKQNGNDYSKTYYYLKSSALAMSTALKYQKFDTKVDERKISLEEGLGDCDEMTNFTYSNFLYITNTLRESYLQEYVRIATGYSYNNSSKDRHKWIEFLVENTWIPFENTFFHQLHTEIDKELSSPEFTRTDSLILNNNKEDYYPLSHLQISDNKKKIWTNHWNVLKDVGGVLVYPVEIFFD